jgi:hypothetical protein
MTSARIRVRSAGSLIGTLMVEMAEILSRALPPDSRLRIGDIAQPG